MLKLYNKFGRRDFKVRPIKVLLGVLGKLIVSKARILVFQIDYLNQKLTKLSKNTKKNSDDIHHTSNLAAKNYFILFLFIYLLIFLISRF